MQYSDWAHYAVRHDCMYITNCTIVFICSIMHKHGITYMIRHVRLCGHYNYKSCFHYTITLPVEASQFWLMRVISYKCLHVCVAHFACENTQPPCTPALVPIGSSRPRCSERPRKPGGSQWVIKYCGKLSMHACMFVCVHCPIEARVGVCVSLAPVGCNAR